MKKLKKNLSKIILILSLSIILSFILFTISKAVSVSYTEITNVEAATINLIESAQAIMIRIVGSLLEHILQVAMG